MTARTKPPTVAYLTTFYTADVDGRLGRFHDWIHRLRDMDDPPFSAEVHAFTVGTPDEMLADDGGDGYLGGGDEVWGRRRNKLEFLLNVPRVRRSLDRSDFDVLHVIQLDTISFPTGVLGRKTPVVVGPDVLGWNPIRSGGRWDVTFPGSLFAYAKFGTKRLLARSGQFDVATAYSDYHREMLERLGIPRERISVLPPGVDPSFAPGEEGAIGEPVRLLYVGDRSRHKGFATLLEAIDRLDRPVEVTVVGGGPTPESLPECVELLGFMPRSELPTYYRRADLYVMPSIDEAGPNTVVEALASGVPVVVTDRPGVAAYPPDDAGVAFAPRTPDELARAIEAAIGDLASLTRSARRHVGRFHVDRVIEALDDLYASLLP